MGGQKGKQRPRSLVLTDAASSFHPGSVFGDFPTKIGIQESLDFAIHHRLEARLRVSRSRVFDPLLRMLEIAANLRTETHLRGGFVLSRHFGLSLLFLKTSEFRAEHPHRHGPILMLTPFTLAGHHDSRGKVR